MRFNLSLNTINLGGINQNEILGKKYFINPKALYKNSSRE